MNRRRAWLALAAMTAVVGTGCGKAGASPSGGKVASIQIDGSSTVFPITEAVAEEFMVETGRDIRVTVAASGTGGGFQRFCSGETDVSNASRPIDPSEIAECAANGVAFRELAVAIDGLAILVHPSNDFVHCLTVGELSRIWEASSTVNNWSQLRPEWPDQQIRLYGPGTNSGTFDYFTQEINGETGASRADYTASEDDNVLVQGVAGDPKALGYFGIAYYMENEERLRVVDVDSGSGCVTPTPETIGSGEYAPLSRPLFIYVKESSLAQPHVRAFVEFYLDSAAALAAEVGYVPLDAPRFAESRATLAQVTDAG